MAYFEYQNIFTQVQVQGKPEMGMDDAGTLSAERTQKASFSTLAGLVGNAQLGPVYLGWAGTISLATGLVWFNIVGFNMLAQVGWSIPEFIRQLFWLALEPPSPEYGLSMPPLNDGGWYIIASFFLLVSVMSWWLRTYLLAVEHKMGKHIAWAFLSAIWLFLVLGLFRPVLMGQWSEAVPYGISRISIGRRPSPSATATFTITRSTVSRSCSSMARCCSLRCTLRPFSVSAALVATASWSRSMTAEQLLSVRLSSGAGPWGSMPRWKGFTVGLGGLRFSPQSQAVLASC